MLSAARFAKITRAIDQYYALQQPVQDLGRALRQSIETSQPQLQLHSALQVRD
jgi:hypothetical protein